MKRRGRLPLFLCLTPPVARPLFQSSTLTESLEHATNKEERFKLVSILLSKMFYGHAIFIGGNSQKGSRYLSFPPGLSLSRPVDTKTDFNLNNIIATLSLISISSVKKFAGKCPDTYSNLISTPLLVSIDAQSCAALTSQSLRATIGPLQDN